MVIGQWRCGDRGRGKVEEKIGKKKKEKYILLYRYIILMSRIGK